MFALINLIIKTRKRLKESDLIMPAVSTFHSQLPNISPINSDPLQIGTKNLCLKFRK